MNSWLCMSILFMFEIMNFMGLKVILLSLPVHGNVVLCIVYNFDHKGISISDCQCWPRELPVDCDSGAGFAQPLHWRVLNLNLGSKRKEFISKQIHNHSEKNGND